MKQGGNPEKTYLSLKQAEKKFGYSPSYLSYLLREKKITGKKVFTTVSWLVSAKSLADYCGKLKNLEVQEKVLRLEKEELSLKEAAQATGYAPDYIGYLIRQKKVFGKKVQNGVSWLVSIDELKTYQEKVNQAIWEKSRFAFLDREVASDIVSDIIPPIREKIRAARKKVSYWVKMVRVFVTATKYGTTVFFVGVIILGSVLVWAINEKEETQTIEIYSLGAQGDWQNPQNAAGPPETEETADFESFSEANSASYQTGPLSVVVAGFRATREDVEKKNPKSSGQVQEETTPGESPEPTESSSPSEDSIPGEIPELSESPMPSESSLPSETLPENESPVPNESSASSETPLPSESPEPTENPLLSESPIPSETPAPTENPLPSETPAPEEPPTPSETPALTENPVPSESPLLPVIEEQGEPLSFLEKINVFKKSVQEKVRKFVSEKIVRAKEIPTFEELTKKEFVSAKIKLSIALGERRPDLIIPTAAAPSESPSPSESPLSSETPVITENPLLSESPIPSEAPETSESPTPTPTPTPTPAPEEPISWLNKVRNFFAVVPAKAEEETPQSNSGQIPSIDGNEDVSATAADSAVEENSQTEILSKETATSEESFPEETATSEEPVPLLVNEAPPNLDDRIIVWYSLDNDTWWKLGTISAYPLSNLINGGYLSFDAPFIKTWDDVKNLQIKLEGVVGGETLVITYLDSVWVEVSYQEKKEEEMELVSAKKDWRADEEPVFEVKQKEQTLIDNLVASVAAVFQEEPKIDAILVSPAQKEVVLREDEDFKAETHSPTKITLFKTNKIKPGRYTIKIDYEKDGKTYPLEQDFTWGVLAINVNKSIYTRNNTNEDTKQHEDAYIQMGVLNDTGHTICNANLKLEITSPDGATKIFLTSSSNPLINTNNDNSLIDTNSEPIETNKENSSLLPSPEPSMPAEPTETGSLSTPLPNQETPVPEETVAPEESLAPTESFLLNEPTGLPTPTESPAPTESPLSIEPAESPAPTESVEPTESPVPTESAAPTESSTAESNNVDVDNEPLPSETLQAEPSPVPLQEETNTSNSSASFGDKIKKLLGISSVKAEDSIDASSSGVIEKSGKCSGNNVTDTPDYFAYYQVGGAGIYEMRLTNLDNGYEITDSFEVRNSLPFEVERIGPTRIYPPAVYEMTLKIKANQDFSGKIIEAVPQDFEILSAELTLISTLNNAENISENPRSNQRVSAEITTVNNEKLIIWNTNLEKGNIYELKYQFDAPDVSPYLYLLGPLRFEQEDLLERKGGIIEKIKKGVGDIIESIPLINNGNDANENADNNPLIDTNTELNNTNNFKGNLVFKEARQWQIAADITCVFGTDTGGGQCRGFVTTTGAGTWPVPADWSNTNTIEVIGAGGGGLNVCATHGCGAGGGGAYSSVSNVTGLTGNINVAVGLGGAISTEGGDTWFGATTCALANVCADGGDPGVANTGGAGGTVVVGTGFSGGAGGSSSGGADGGGGGGGGAAGPGGVGRAGGSPAGDGGGGGGGSGGSSSTVGGNGDGVDAGGAGGNGPGGSGGGTVPGGIGTVGGGGGGGTDDTTETGGNGGMATQWTSVGTGGGGGGAADAGNPGAGSIYGGGGGGGGEDTLVTSTNGTGANGIIVITYTPTPADITPTVPVYSDTPDPVAQLSAITFSAGWEDADSGASWTRATAYSQWGKRSMYTSLVFNNPSNPSGQAMWVIGGYYYETPTTYRFNNVWYSTDGISWTQATVNAQWEGRTSHASLVFNNQMWVIGGSTTGSSLVNNVWYSSNGISWTQATVNAQWGGRYNHSSLVFNNQMWVIGGDDIIAAQNVNDVWYSSNGITWTQATVNAQWGRRDNHTSLVFNNQMWVIGGYTNAIKNDVWYSSNGISWTQATLYSQWGKRRSHTSLVFNNQMWVIGGYDSDTGANFNDAWYSSNGISWTQATLYSQWGKRYDHSSLVFNNQMWVTGGYDSTAVAYVNDVWYAGGELAKAHFCKTNTINSPTTGGSCTGGSWYDTTTATSTNPLTGSYTTTASETSTRGYYPYVCSDGGTADSCSKNTPLGVNWVDAGARNDGTGSKDYAQWSARSGHSSLVYNNQMWVIGGSLNDVWYSSNGITWTQATVNAQWSARSAHSSLVYNNQMWVIGGTTGSAVNSVWYSSNGITWTQATVNAQWLARSAHSSLVYNNQMWVIGGWDVSSLDRYNDVWYSTNGITWTKATANSQWAKREAHTSLVFNNQMWVIGGFDSAASVYVNNVWYSSNGISWTMATAYSQWGGRRDHTSRVFNNQMWVIGGYNGTGVFFNDVWYSSNGITWTQATANCQWSGRYRLASLVFNNQMWVIGGGGNDVWKIPDAGLFYVNESPSVTTVSDSPDPVASGSNIAFSVTWDDQNLYYPSELSEGISERDPAQETSTYIGALWSQATAYAQWEARNNIGGAVFNSKIWVIGGTRQVNNVANDVWWSSDGTTWTQATAYAQWSARYGHSIVSFNSQLWLIGGWAYNDVWYSSTGTTWTQATANAQWVARRRFTSVVYDNKVWIIGGHDISEVSYNDVWYSSNGITWTKATAYAQWGAREDHASVYYNNQIWVVGGSPSSNDVWYSSNGITWTRATVNAQWGVRYDHEFVVLDDKMWLMAGAIWSGTYYNDVWYSINGISWTQVTANARWLGRTQQAAAFVSNNKLWILAGYNQTSNISYNDVWYSDIETVKVKTHICKTNAIENPTTGGSCASGQTWASSSDFSATNPSSLSYTATTADIATSPNPYWAFVCDDKSLSNSCSSTTASSTDTFTVQSGEAADVSPTVPVYSDTPDPVAQLSAITFSAGWEDADAGTSWTQATANAQWSTREGSWPFVYDNKMWILGGYDGGYLLNDVWYSANGISWTKATTNAQWAARGFSAQLVYNNYIWIVGGRDPTNFNDVWYSSTGITWTKATTNAQWSARSSLSPAVFDNKMWIIGDDGNSVWYSSTGASWTQATANAQWAARGGHRTLVFENKIWLISGWPNADTNDVWYSLNGASWTQATANAQWAARNAVGAVNYNNKLWMLGGSSRNDVWYSINGVSWTQVTANAQWGGRAQFTATVFNNKIWVWAGNNYTNDVWYSGGELAKAHFCKTNAITSQDTGGSCNSSGSWYDTATATSTNPLTGSYTTTTSETSTRKYFPYVCSDAGNSTDSCSKNTPLGALWVDAGARNDGTGAKDYAQWGKRYQHTSLVYNNQMWVIGGWDNTAGADVNDVWYSSNGITWTKATTYSQWRGREAHTSVIYNNQMWVMGGRSTTVIQFDAASYHKESTVSPPPASTTLSFEHTVGSGNYRLLIVGLTYGESAWEPTPTVTYAGQTMTLVYRKDSANTSAAMWYLLSPATGTNTVLMTGLSSSGDDRIAGAVSFFNVDQSNPLGSYASATGTGNAITVNVSSASGEVVVDVASTYNGTSMTVGADQTEHWNQLQVLRLGGSSREPGSTTTTMSWTGVSVTNWAIVAVPIKRVADARNDVWYSSNGISWTQATANSQWGTRYAHTALVFNNQMWVIGGWDSTLNAKANDVWYSTNGISWTRATVNSQWGSRYYHTALVYNNQMWVIGGYAAAAVNDVWYSSNGISWTQATAYSQWAIRSAHASVVYNNQMWVMAGAGAAYYNDVWYSAVGTTWTQATAYSQWAARSAPASVVYNNQMWVLGGGYASTYVNDVWKTPTAGMFYVNESPAVSSVTDTPDPVASGSDIAFSVTWDDPNIYWPPEKGEGISEDSPGQEESIYLGTSWTSPGRANWVGRYGFGLVIHNSQLWLTGGWMYNDVWYSSDGATWTQKTVNAQWTAKRRHGALSYNNKLWVIGGQEYPADVASNNVWYSDTGDTWTRATVNAQWSAREDMAEIVFDSKMWIMGGSGVLNDVWYSTTGYTWTRATANAQWGGRYAFSSVVFDNQMWIAGGSWAFAEGAYFNDVWYSSNGTTWTQATANSQWKGRLTRGSFTTKLDEKMWILGNWSWTGTALRENDVWYSTNGISWTQAIANAEWIGRDNANSAIFNQKIWVMGGISVSGSDLNDIWYSNIETVKVKTHICKTNAIENPTTGGSCASGQTWVSASDFSATDPSSLSYTATTADVATSPNSYWAFVCDDKSLSNSCSSTTASSTDTFTVTSVGIDISGSVKGTDESSFIGNPPCNGTTLVVSLRVNGGTESTIDCDNTTGNYSFTNVSANAGDTVTIYLNTSSTPKANLVMVAGSVAVNDANIFQDRVIVRDEQDGTINISDMWDYDNTADPTNMLFDAVSGTPNTLTLDSGAELHVWTGDIFDPNGTVTTQGAAGDLHLAVNSTCYFDTATSVVSGNVVVVGGGTSTTFSVGATTTVGGGSITTSSTNTTITYTATPTLTISGTGSIGGGTSPSITFYDLILSGTSTMASASTINKDLTVNGTMQGSADVTTTVNGGIIGSGIINMTGGMVEQRITAAQNFRTTADSANWIFNNLQFSNYSSSSAYTVTTPDGTGTITVNGTLTVGLAGDTFATTLAAGNRFWTLVGSGTPFVITATKGALTENTSTFNYIAATTTNVTADTYYNLGAGTTADASAVTYTLAGNTTVTSVLTVGNAGSSATDNLAGSSYTLTLSGSGTPFSIVATYGNFSEGTSTVSYIAATTTNVTAETYYNLSIGTANSASPAYNAAGAIACTNNLSLQSAAATYTNTFAMGTNNLTVGSASITDSGSITVPTLAALTQTSGTTTIKSSTGSITPTIGGAGTLTFYNLYFAPDAASGPTFKLGNAISQTITISNNLTIGNGTNAGIVDVTTYDPTLDVNNSVIINASGTLTASNSGTFTVAGNWTNSTSGVFTHSSGTVTFDAGATGKTITDGGDPFYKIVFDNALGGWTYQDGAATAPNTTTVSNGAVSYINAKVGGLSVTSGTLTTDWYLGIHVVNASNTATSVDTGVSDITIIETATSAPVVWRYDGGWGVGASSQTTGTGSDGKNPQLYDPGAIKLREYSMTNSSACPGAGCTLYNYNLQIDWQPTYGQYDYYKDFGSLYVSSCWQGTSSACGNATTVDDTIGDSWHRSTVGSMNNQGPPVDYRCIAGAGNDCLNEAPTDGSWYAGMFNGLSFSITPPLSVDLGTIMPGDPPTNATSVLTVSTSATNGYVVNAWSTQVMTCAVSNQGRCGTETISDWSGTNESPSTWNTGSFGFGYSTNDTNLSGGDPNRFATSTKYAGFTRSGFAKPVADRDATECPCTSQTNTITYRVAASNTQRPGTYETTVIYVATANY